MRRQKRRGKREKRERREGEDKPEAANLPGSPPPTVFVLGPTPEPVSQINEKVIHFEGHGGEAHHMHTVGNT